MSRPLLLPGVPALWRGPRTLQLGLDPDRAVILEFHDPAVARLLPLVDGTRTEPALLAEAVRRGVSPLEVGAMLQALREHGLIVGAHTLLPPTLPEPVRRRITAEAAALALRGDRTPAQILRRRAAARIKITGRGRLGVPIALVLAAAGVGHVDPNLDGYLEPGEASAADVPRPRRTAVSEAIVRTSPGTEVGPLRRGDTTFVVQVGTTAPAELQAAAYRQHQLAHLAVGLRDGTAIVGPLVPPRGSPCLNCLELHRKDRDPAWPDMAGQLAVMAPAAGTVSEAVTATTTLAAATYAGAEVLRYLDGETPLTLGATVEISAPGVDRRRTWSPHPGCVCADRRRATPRRNTLDT